MRVPKFLAVTSSIFALLFAIQIGYTSPIQSEPFELTSIALHKVTEEVSLPLAIVSTGIEGDTRLFIAERTGKIKILEDGKVHGTPFLSLEGEVSLEQERGFLGMVFDPDYANNGYFYVNYSDKREATYGDTVISRFEVSADPNVALEESETIILEVKQEFDNHNGGHLLFDSTGQLIIGLGDGGGIGDPFNRAQDKTSLLGKMLRINVNGVGLEPTNGCGRIRNYKIPADNPKPNGEDGWCAEILSSGWRHPWRYSLDPETGRMWVGDVGENLFEEINLVPKTTTVLRDYGWSCLETWSPFKVDCGAQPDTLRTAPVIVYARRGPEPELEFLGASVTGGLVYTGQKFPELQRHYFFGDFSSGKVWAVDKDLQSDHFEVIGTDFFISTFGEGNDGEAYLADYISGGIYQLIGNHAAEVKQFAPEFTKPGEAVTWTFEVKNIGTQTLKNVALKNDIPLGVVWFSGGSVTANQVEIIIPEIPAGTTETVSWTGTAPVFEGPLRNDQLSIDADEISFTDLINSNSTTIVAEIVSTVHLPVVVR